MDKKIYIIIIIIALFISCQTYEPFKSQKDKERAIRFINKEFHLADSVKKSIDDSIYYHISQNLKDSVSHKLIQRRLDSLKYGNYSNKELYFMIRLDRITSKYDFGEFEIHNGNNDDKKFGKIDSFEQVEEIIKAVNNMKIKTKDGIIKRKSKK